MLRPETSKWDTAVSVQMSKVTICTLVFFWKNFSLATVQIFKGVIKAWLQIFGSFLIFTSSLNAGIFILNGPDGLKTHRSLLPQSTYYLEYHSAFPLVGIGTTPHRPLSRKRVCPPPRTKGGEGGTHTPECEGVGESEFGQLSRKLSTLSFLWLLLFHHRG